MEDNCRLNREIIMWSNISVNYNCVIIRCFKGGRFWAGIEYWCKSTGICGRKTKIYSFMKNTENLNSLALLWTRINSMNTNSDRNSVFAEDYIYY